VAENLTFGVLSVRTVDEEVRAVRCLSKSAQLYGALQRCAVVGSSLTITGTATKGNYVSS
jgi:hypothetical protein